MTNGVIRKQINQRSVCDVLYHIVISHSAVLKSLSEDMLSWLSLLCCACSSSSSVGFFPIKFAVLLLGCNLCEIWRKWQPHTSGTVEVGPLFWWRRLDVVAAGPSWTGEESVCPVLRRPQSFSTLKLVAYLK